MKRSVLFAVLFALTIPAVAQVSASRALHPLTKQGVLQTPQQAAGRTAPAPAPAAAPVPAATAAAGAQPSAIEPNLHPSKISLFGKIDGLSGTFFVTNSGPRAVKPFAQLAVLDKNGRPVGWVTNSAPQIQPNQTGKIQVLATNANAVDLKIVKLVGRK